MPLFKTKCNQGAVGLCNFKLLPAVCHFALLLDVIRDVWSKKSGSDIAILESYFVTRDIQPKSTLHKLRYRREATALLPLVESLVKTVRHDEKQTAFSQLEKTRKISLETNKKHSIRLAALNQLLIHIKNVLSAKK